MLVLSRKKNESIVIDDDISLVVVEIRGDKVRLGVEAPKEASKYKDRIRQGKKAKASKTLETNVQTSLLTSPRRQFEEYLKTGEYLEASKMVSKHPHLANYDELYKLTIELGNQLQEDRRRK